MGKPTGFQEWPRQPAEKRAKHERLQDFREFALFGLFLVRIGLGER